MELRSGLRDANYIVSNKPKMTKAEAKKLFALNKEKDMEKVAGIFQNIENPRGSVTFAIKLYDEMPEIYQLEDGERYALPRGVIKHLNSNCWYPEYKHMPGQRGQEGVRNAMHDGKLNANNWQVMTKIHRYRFNRLDFGDDYELNPSDIAQVQATL